jgi:hypothetical protein
MSIESVEIKRFRDAEGRPACALDFDKGLVCPFVYAARLGTTEACKGRYLARRDWNGYLMPHQDCPIWAEKEKKYGPGD